MPRQHAPTVAILLAAGRGSRAQPYTQHTPKCLLSFNGRPIIDYILDSLWVAGLSHIYVVTHHLESKLVTHLTNNLKSGLDLTFCRQDNLLGTADALASTRDAILKLMPQPSTLLISATDYALPKSYVKDLISFHITHTCPITVSLRSITPEEVCRSSVAIRGGNDQVLHIVEKPESTSYDAPLAASLLYITPASIYRYIDLTPFSKRGEYELSETINMMLLDGICSKGFVQPQLPSIENIISA
jgi:bifunctional UDP-N-acetylglucosamine pyrophosphorylase/glucosamine-1-phosphate N-acetyltransferase